MQVGGRAASHTPVLFVVSSRQCTPSCCMPCCLCSLCHAKQPSWISVTHSTNTPSALRSKCNESCRAVSAIDVEKQPGHCLCTASKLAQQKQHCRCVPASQDNDKTASHTMRPKLPDVLLVSRQLCVVKTAAQQAVPPAASIQQELLRL